MVAPRRPTSFALFPKYVWDASSIPNALFPKEIVLR
jgi:hypothetical protein